MEGGGATMTMEVIEEEEVGGGQQQQQVMMARPPPPEQQMARITTCEKHPDVPVVGLCALCLRERLVDLEVSRRNNNNNNNNADSSSSASAILKSIFFRAASSSNSNHSHNQQQQQHYSQQQQQHQRSNGGGSSVLLPQLRRCKSFSAGRRDGSYATPRASTSLEPQRRSCDVRGRNTLWSLFHQDDIDHHLHHPLNPRHPSSSSLLPPKVVVVPPTTISTGGRGGGDLETDRSRNLGFPPTAPVPESKEEEELEEFEDAIGGKEYSTRHHSRWEKEEEEEKRNYGIGVTKDDDGKEEEEEKPTVDEEVEGEEDVIEEEEEMDVVKAEDEAKVRRRMRNENTNLEEEEEGEQEQTTTKKPPAKDLKEIAGSFWLAASVFSKKLRKWRQKQKLKRQQQQQQQNNSSTKKNQHHYHHHHRQQQQQQLEEEEQQDIYCSFSSSYKLPSSSSLSSSSSLRPPRGSLDMMMLPPEDLVSLGRRSCDVIAPPRFSLDAGRMSLDDTPWDEPRASWDGYLLGGGRSVSVFARQPPFIHPSASDDNGLVQRSDGLIPVEEDLSTPGGALQARDYYGDFNRRGAARRSLDRSNSIMLKRASEENGGGSSARVSFELGLGGGGPNDSFHYSSTSLRGDDWSESFDSTSYNRDPTSTATTTTITKEERHMPPKKSRRRRWSRAAWNLWGFIHRSRSNDRGRNVVGRSMSETWPHEFNSRRMLRSNSSVWGRSSYNGSMNAGFGGLQSNCNGNGLHTDVNGGQWRSNSKKRRDGFALERNRSTRYSPANNADSNGMLRFYLPPMRSGRHGAKRSVREGFGNPNAFPRSVLQLY